MLVFLAAAAADDDDVVADFAVGLDNVRFLRVRHDFTFAKSLRQME